MIRLNIIDIQFRAFRLAQPRIKTPILLFFLESLLIPKLFNVAKSFFTQNDICCRKHYIVQQLLLTSIHWVHTLLCIFPSFLQVCSIDILSHSVYHVTKIIKHVRVCCHWNFRHFLNCKVYAYTRKLLYHSVANPFPQPTTEQCGGGKVNSYVSVKFPGTK